MPGWTDSGDRCRIVAVGKLERQKGFDLLIRAASRLHLPWTLLILGEGSEKDRLRRLGDDLGVSDRVHLPGFVRKPFPYVAAADLLVLSSRWEGFGHVITEAMACGTPVLATRCPSGPDEIIEDGADGRLCEPASVEALAWNMDDLLRSPEIRRAYAQAAARSVVRFDAPTVVRQYEALFADLVATS